MTNLYLFCYFFSGLKCGRNIDSCIRESKQGNKGLAKRHATLCLLWLALTIGSIVCFHEQHQYKSKTEKAQKAVAAKTNAVTQQWKNAVQKTR